MPRRQKNRSGPVVTLMIIAVGAILALEAFSLARLLPQTPQESSRIGLWGFAIALALSLFLLAWVLIRQFLGRYEENLFRWNDQLSEANTRLRELSMTDSLTGLYNRRFFDDHFRIEFQRAKRTGNPLSLLLIDLDDFKKINDQYGHDAGDEVLLSVAKALRLQVRRGGDMLARYGGEEFVAVLPETNAAAAEELAQRILEVIRGASIVHRGDVIRVSASIGMATQRPGSDRESDLALFRTSDEALYEAKKAGKNCVRMAPIEPEKEPGTLRNRSGSEKAQN